MGKAFSLVKTISVGIAISAIVSGCGSAATSSKNSSSTSSNPSSSNSGSGTSTQSSGSSSGVQNITFWDMEWGGPQYNQEGEQLVAEFNKTHPNIHVTYQAIPWTNWYQTFATAIASGTGPDVSSGAAYEPFQFYQDMMDLSPIISDWKESGVINQYTSQEINALKYQGKQIAIPWDIDIRILLYNKALFAQHHLQPPKTWDDFYKDAVALSGNGKYAFGTTTGSGAMQVAFFFMLDNGGGIFNQDGTLNFSGNPKNVQAIDFMHKLAMANAIDPAGPGWSNSSQANSAFSQGQIAMMIASPQTISQLPQSFQQNVGVAPLLVSSNGSQGTEYWNNGLMAYKSSKYPQADYTFLEWWAANDAKMLADAQMLPANTKLQQNPIYQSGYWKVILNDYMAHATTTAAYDPHLFPKMNSIEGESALPNMITMITQKQPVNTVIQQTDAALKNIMNGN